MDDLGETVYNLGKWANSNDIDEARDTITPTMIETINTANSQTEQETFLAENKAKLEEQQEEGDVFENACPGCGDKTTIDFSASIQIPPAIKRVAGGLSGAAISVGKIGDPFIHPVETYKGMQTFIAIPNEDKPLAIQLAVAMDIQERVDNRALFESLNDPYGVAIVDGMNAVDSALIIGSIAKAPASLASLAAKLKSVGTVTVGGVKYVLTKAGEIKASRVNKIVTSNTNTYPNDFDLDNVYDYQLLPRAQVTAEVIVDGKRFYDTNQTSRAANNPDIKTEIFDEITEINIERLLNGQSIRPNDTMRTAHAEIGALQQAHNTVGLGGKDITVKVDGLDFCGHCQKDIVTFAKKTNVKSITVNAISTKGYPVIYYWEKGMNRFKRTRVKK